MLRADRRVVVSHVGSLVRPPAMIPYLEKIRDKEPYDEAAFEKCLTDSVAEAVRLQAEAGIDVVSDSEYGKSVNWACYVHQRLSGLTWRPYTAEEAKDDDRRHRWPRSRGVSRVLWRIRRPRPRQCPRRGPSDRHWPNNLYRNGRAAVTTQGPRSSEGQRSPETTANGDLSHDSRRTDATD